MSIAQRYAQLRAAVPPSVTIVAVSKFQPVEAIAEAIAAGVTDIGENYVQEARRKFDRLRHGELVEPRKHFIGHIQTNKAKAIAAAFDMVQSVDRADAATALAKAADALGKRLTVLLQLNVSPSERFGCSPAEAPRLADLIRAQSSLELQGIMAIGPITGDRSEIARAFELAAQTLRGIGGTTLSLGMSDDWPVAVEAGSTMIRVGSTIFGPRPTRPASKSTAIP
jgi:PLP dependent protein